jgi:hypothetical protein
MKQGIQEKLGDPVLKKYGCYFLALLRWAEVRGGKCFDEKAVENLFFIAQNKGFVDFDCTVKQAHKVYNLAVGGYVFRDTYFSAERPASGDYIVCLKKPGFTHFVFSHNGEIWDGLDPDRPAAKSYAPDSYRLLIPASG